MANDISGIPFMSGISKMFRTGSVLDLGSFQTLEYLYGLDWLSIPNLKTPNLKSSKIRDSLSIKLALKKFWISEHLGFED